MIITTSKKLNLVGTHLFYAFIFIVLSIFYFKPAVFEKKELKQHDIFEHRGGAKELADYRGRTGKEALWTNSMFSGMPSYLISTLYPGELVKNWASTFWSFFPPYTLLLLVSLFSFYILMLAFDAKPVVAAIGAIGFAFSSFTVISIFAGHNTKVVAMGYMPLVLAGVVWLMKERYLFGFIVAAIGFSLNIGANHYQITYYLLLLIGVLFIIDFILSIKQKKLIPFFQKTGLLIAAISIGICTNIASILTTLEYSSYSRGGSEIISTGTNGSSESNQKGLDKDYVFNWSLGKFETISLLIPNIQGGASIGDLPKKSAFYKALIDSGYPSIEAEQAIQRLPIYWGDQPFTAGPVYFGAIICFLFVLGLFIIDKKIKYWLLIGTIFSILLAWGKNFDFFNTLIFDYLPGYNKFRAVTMILIVGQLCMCIGAALAIQKIIELNYTKGLIKKVGIATGITAGICLLIYIISSMLRYETAYDLQMFKDATQYLDALKKDRADLLRKDALRSLFFILASASLLFFLIKKKINKNIAFVGLLLLVIVDLWIIDKRYLNNEKFEKKAIAKHFTITPADEFILKDPTLYYRVVNVQRPFGEARTSYFHKSIGGYHGAKLHRYQDVIDYHLFAELNNVTEKVKKTGSMDQLQIPVLNMLNTKYFIFNDSPNGVLKNEQANGNAWFIEKVETTNSPNEEIEKLGTINTKTTAVIDENKFKLSSYAFEKDSSAYIKLEKYEPNHLIYKASNPKNGLGVFSDIYYPKGWKASIDGKDVPISRVNYILRAIEIPAGNHTIEFKFEPASYYSGNKIALVSSLLLIGMSLVGITFQLINKRKKKNLLI